MLRMCVHVQAIEMSGKSQFPFMIDPNNGKQMLESDAIINYLWNEYGDGQVRHTIPVLYWIHITAPCMSG